MFVIKNSFIKEMSEYMVAGIYGIFDAETNECLYVGQSGIISERWKQHLKKLKNKTHSRKDFVKWYYAKGAIPELIVFRILEKCDNNECSLNLAETKWFQSMKPKFYGKQPSLNESWTHSEKTKINISESVKNSLKNKIYLKKCKSCDKDFNEKHQMPVIVLMNVDSLIVQKYQTIKLPLKNVIVVIKNLKQKLWKEFFVMIVQCF